MDTRNHNMEDHKVGWQGEIWIIKKPHVAQQKKQKEKFHIFSDCHWQIYCDLVCEKGPFWFSKAVTLKLSSQLVLYLNQILGLYLTQK